MSSPCVSLSADINECSEDNGGCSSVCNNTIGSYVCTCEAGYELDMSGYNCSGKIIPLILIDIRNLFKWKITF